MIMIKPSEPFSNGMSYELFEEIFCYRCKHGKLREDGFPEFPENGDCPIWDAMENARFDLSCFPRNDVVQIERDGEVVRWNICKHFVSDEATITEAYKALFEEDRT